jgi:rubrerythrin
MSISFYPDEILEMAVHIERNGARFYRQAAQGAQDAEVRELLRGLADMEEKHENFFVNMRANLGKDEINYNADEQNSLYLKSWADGQVFDLKSDPVKRIKDQKNMEGILKVPIELEKESILFYLGMKNGVNNKTYRDRIEEIIKEEMKHIVSLSAQLSSLKK